MSYALSDTFPGVGIEYVIVALFIVGLGFGVNNINNFGNRYVACAPVRAVPNYQKSKCRGKPLIISFKTSRYPAKTFGQQVKKFRLEKELSQKALAEMLEVNKMTIVNWEKDRRKPSREHKERIIDFFGTDLLEEKR
jgi:DNA-binding XRE family transcriptional regulator